MHPVRGVEITTVTEVSQNEKYYLYSFKEIY